MVEGPLVLPPALFRVEEPDFPGAIASSDRGAVLSAPPPPGTAWTREAFPEVDASAEEGVHALNADLWQATGSTGAGVRVAVFDVQWFGAETHPAELGAFETWDCWAHRSCEVPMDTLRPAFASEVGGHGWACAEVIRAIAPDVELHLVRVNGRTALENAVAWAIREDIDLISMSLSFFGNSFYDGTGPVNELMDELRDADVLMVTSAGNYARGHWAGRWQDGDGDGRLDFDGDNRLTVELTAGRAGAIYLAWDQYRGCGATDLDMLVYDREGRVVARSEEAQDPNLDGCEPAERLNALVRETGLYEVEVIARRGQRMDLALDLFAKDGRIPDTVPQGSVVDPGTSPHVLTVGAADAAHYLDGPLEVFSSQGPTKAGLAKPEIVGPDGLSTRFYGARGFYGTSASTPAVVGALALLLSAEPDLSPWQAAERLEGAAWGGRAGWEAPDPGEGWGRARLPPPAEGQGCGRRRVLLPLWLLPLWWWGSRRRE